MEAYTDFASVYDTFMDETPYDVWGNFIAELIEKYGISKPAVTEQDEIEENSEEALTQEKNLVVELGCGTGSFTIEMAKKGYDIMGIDLSPDMLDIARNKAAKEGLNLMFLEQDMRELDLYCTAGTIVSVCDSINYLLENDDVIETFRLVNNFLFPKGLFIFDFNTLHKYRDVIGDVTIAENREDCSFIWDNYYHDKEHINEYDLTIYACCDKKKELFRRSVETHYQRGYTLEEMISFIEQAGLEYITAIDADTHAEPTPDSERIYIIAKEAGKNM
ncbi:Methyltransferase domain-containing protein [Butyrivibrio proteoclasticus]|uniref:Methyltransferase domain-containing protein n=1 Tax=Butyrivibrio proteoclasticus TaxID=43305 RepID=A0A1I5X5N5_9FIRM|nr:class I SAM-dependent methyltransferase [Butyrivibrio proteoclasticus]SFQ27303.1 Methyltransferase domain-containing protein [Butyrivibrio proteoclasticus]